MTRKTTEKRRNSLEKNYKESGKQVERKIKEDKQQEKKRRKGLHKESEKMMWGVKKNEGEIEERAGQERNQFNKEREKEEIG